MVNDAAAREVEFILGIGGITIVTGRELGDGLSLDQLRREHDAVFLALGHNTVNSLGLDNEDALNVHDAVDFIARIRQEPLDRLPVGRQVLVIGGGNTAIDIAVQVKKLGAEAVTLVYRRGREDMGATDHEQALAQTQGVLIRSWARPVAIETANGAVHRVEFEGTDTAHAGERFHLPADQLFKAIGQGFEPKPFAGAEAPKMSGGRIQVDSDGRTSLPDVWAGGDCIPGRDLTVTAVQDGKRAAASIQARLVDASGKQQSI
jgi:glutamate synthase (NADPH/NADH) small chain